MLEITERSSVAARVILLVTSVIFVLGTAGLVFGYAAFKQILLSCGVYKFLGDDDQPLRMDLMYTIASSATNCMAIVIGLVLDRYGPRVTASIGSVTFLLGTLAFAVTPPPTESGQVDLMIPGYTMLAIGGPFIFISTLHVARVFPQHSGLCMSLITGAFDASSIIFFLFQQIFGSLDNAGVKQLQVMFGVYAIVPFCALLWSLVIMPRRAFGSYEQLADSSDVEENAQNDVKRPGNSFKQATAVQQICSVSFLLLTLYMCVYMVRLNLYISSVRDQLTRVLNSGSDSVSTVSWWFGLLLPLGGVLAIPLSTFTLDRLPLAYSIHALTLLNLISAVASYWGTQWTQLINIAAFVVMRPMLYTVTNEYVGRVFGVRHFGVVYGLMTAASGLFNLTQYLLAWLIKYKLDGDYVVVNSAVYAVTLVLGIVFSAFIMVERPELDGKPLPAGGGSCDTLLPADVTDDETRALLHRLAEEDVADLDTLPTPDEK